MVVTPIQCFFHVGPHFLFDGSHFTFRNFKVRPSQKSNQIKIEFGTKMCDVFVRLSELFSLVKLQTQNLI